MKDCPLDDQEALSVQLYPEIDAEPLIDHLEQLLMIVLPVIELQEVCKLRIADGQRFFLFLVFCDDLHDPLVLCFATIFESQQSFVLCS